MKNTWKDIKSIIYLKIPPQIFQERSLATAAIV